MKDNLSLRGFRVFATMILMAAFGAAFAHGGSGTVTPTAASISSSGASGYVTGTGVSIQFGANQGSATVDGGANGSGVGLGPVKAAGADAHGAAATKNTSIAGGVTFGPGSTGSHDAAGKSTASIAGSAEGHTVTNGPAAIANGNVEAVTVTKASGTGTGIGAVSAGVAGSFDAKANASQVKVGNFNQIDTTSTALGGVVGNVNFNGSLGSTTTVVDNQGAFNSFGQAKAGIQSSTSN